MNLLAQTATGRWQPGMSAAWFHLPRRQQFHLALVLIGGLVILLDVLPIWSQATIWAALVLIQVARCRSVWTKPFGAVLLYDLVRSARKGRFAMLRCVYALALLLVFLAVYWEEFIGASLQLSRLWTGGTVNGTAVATRIPEFTESFTYRLLGIQFAAAVLLTPVCAAGAIAEEKDRRTLDYLLASDLSNAEIVFGKLLSRLAYLGLIMLTGLPFLSLLQLLGGVDPSLVVVGLVVTLMTMLSLAGLSIVNSVYTSRPLTAVIMTYVQAAAYLLFSGLAVWAFGAPGPQEILFRGASSGNTILTFDRLLRWQQQLGPTPISLRDWEVPGYIGEYAGFHGLIGLGCAGFAALRLRARNRIEAGRRAPRPFSLALRPRRKPPMSDRPMLWKEIYAEPLVRFHRAGLVVGASVISTATVMIIYLSVVMILVMFLLGSLALGMNAWARWMGMSLGSLLLLGVAVRAASSISGERDRLTLDSLLASPLGSRAILRAKWLGSVLAVRKPAFWLLGIWVVGVAAGGVHIVAALELLAAWLIYAAFLASLGLYLSLVSRNAMRATIAMLLIALVISLGPWLLGRYLDKPGNLRPAMLPAGGDELSYVERHYLLKYGAGSQLARSDSIFAMGLSPSATLFSGGFSTGDLEADHRQAAKRDRYYWEVSLWEWTHPEGASKRSGYTFWELWGRMSIPIPGLLGYSVLAAVFWFLTRIRFDHCTQGRSFRSRQPSRTADAFAPMQETLLEPAR